MNQCKYMIILLSLQALAFTGLGQQQIRGQVVDEKDRSPLPGAIIKAESTKQTVITDNDGKFSLQLENGTHQLSIHYLGYQAKDVNIQIPRSGDLVIALQANEHTLDEVVIIGYGATTKKLNTGSVGRVTAEEISKQPVANPLATLHGRVPGLFITQNSGVNGAGFKVQIRGQGSLMQGSDPLFIIDGVPFSAGNNPINSVSSAAGSGGNSGISPFSTINPADIESIEILKDADATSIYGSRGANGVVLITTKKGHTGKTKFDINLYSGFSRVTRTMDMLNTTQYIEMRREAFKNDGTSITNSTGPDLLLWDTNRYTDFKKLLIGGTANTSDAQLHISGGNVNTQYLLGGGYHKETTVFPGNQSDNRVSAKLNLNHLTTDKKFGMDIIVNYASTNSNLSTGDLTRYINTPPNLLLFNSEGNLNWQEGGVYYGGLITNPLAATHTRYSGKFQNLISNLNLNYQILDGLKIKTSLGYNSLMGNDRSLNPSSSINPNSGSLAFSNFGKTALNSWIIEPKAEYITSLAKGKLNVLIGGTLQQIGSDNILVLAQNYRNDVLLSSIAAAGNVTTTNNDYQYKYNGIYGRLNYNWQDKYIVNLTGRRDGSSRFGPGRQFANFGAIGAAWIFSNESFIKSNLPFLSFGKLRGSYGTSGNDQIGNYKYLNTWSNTNQPYQGLAGLQPISLFNADFSWEINRKSEYALELGFMDNKILLSAAYFKNRSGNQLINYKLPVQTGFNSILKNFEAVIENYGLEFSMSTKNITSQNFIWSTSFNLSVPKNKLVKFPGLETSTYANTYVIGEPLSTRQVYQYLGVDAQTGIYKFNDINNDGTYGAADRIILKNTQPEFYGGLQNSFAFKGLQMDVFLEFKKQPGYNYLFTQSSFIPGYYYINQPVVVLERWQNPGDVASIQRYAATGASTGFIPASNYLAGSDAVFNDASYIRLKNIALSYRFFPNWIKKYHIENLRLYIQAQNLFTITNYLGADPENQNLFVLPPLRSLTAGIQLTL